MTCLAQAEHTTYASQPDLLRVGETGTYRYRVELLRVVSPVVLEVGLVPAGLPVPYRPGQYVLVGSAQGDVPERAYSVANAPRADGRVRLLVTRYAGGVTSGWIHRGLARGDEVLLTGPYGTLVADPTRDGPVLLLAAGCGVAPISAVAESLVTDRPDRRVTLCFSGRTSAHVLQRARFEAMQRRHAQFRYVVTLTRDRTAPWHRRLPDLLGKLVGDLTAWEVLIAGNENFVRACRAEVQALGAPAAAVRTEEFFADPVPWSDGLPPLASAARTS
ncbi:MAG TPA: FAD-binding oxidoreductase [Ornithinicoccus sp.]|nr:FAD-binding oxidoreductase [Ornithinicoccus sp.]